MWQCENDALWATFGETCWQFPGRLKIDTQADTTPSLPAISGGQNTTGSFRENDLVLKPQKELCSKYLLSSYCGDDEEDDENVDFDDEDGDVDDDEDGDDDVVHPPLSFSRLALSFVHSADWLSYNITNQLRFSCYQENWGQRRMKMVIVLFPKKEKI